MILRRSERRPAFQGLRLFRFSDVPVPIGGQAHPVEAQAGHGDYLLAVVTACNALGKTSMLSFRAEQRCHSERSEESRSEYFPRRGWRIHRANRRRDVCATRPQKKRYRKPSLSFAVEA